MKTKHLFFHNWYEVDMFQLERLYISVNESGFRYYKCPCGKEKREPSSKLIFTGL